MPLPGGIALCLIFLWFKRKDVWEGMLISQQNDALQSGIVRNFLNYQNIRTFRIILLGVFLLLAAIFMPSYEAYLVFQVLLASLGVFVIFFDMGDKIPSILFAIYGFTITFPLAILRFAEDVYS